MTGGKVAIVTGSNRGIGFAIVKALCEKLNGTVYLTARDPKKGEEAVEKLKALGLKPSFHQLDVTDDESVNKFRNHIKNTHGKIDILINNAGIRILTPDPTGVYAQQTIEVNYFGLLRVCNALFPLLNDNAKVINVSSSAGHLYRIPEGKKRDAFAKKDLTINELNSLMKQYIEDFKNNNLEAEGWPKSAYVASKVGVSALSIIQQRCFDNEKPSGNIQLNFIHPGWVKTDLNEKGNITPDESAKTFLWLALEADIKGKYVWYDKQIIDWYGPSTPSRPYAVEYRK